MSALDSWLAIYGEYKEVVEENEQLKKAVGEARIIVNNYIYKHRTPDDYIKALNWDRQYGKGINPFEE